MTRVASLKRLQLYHWSLVGVGAAVSVLIGQPRTGGGIVLGGGVMGCSVWLNAVGLRRVLGKGSPRLAIGLVSVKLLAFLGLGAMAFRSGGNGGLDPVGLALGIGCFFVAALSEALRVRATAR